MLEWLLAIGTRALSVARSPLLDAAGAEKLRTPIARFGINDYFSAHHADKEIVDSDSRLPFFELRIALR